MSINKEYSKIFNNWEVTEEIGSGSYGKVFKMQRNEGNVSYASALKVITIPQNDSEIKAKRAEGESQESISTYYQGVTEGLLNEIQIMAELRGNSNIVSYEDHQIVRHEDGIGCDIFIRMELLTSFIDYMASNEIKEKDIIRLGIDICKALEICEKKKIIHRDIKPGNIFVSNTGDFKLGDFGIARTIEKTVGGLSKKGTYRYMAPEVYKGEPYGKTVDICSLGLVMYYLANGKRTPFLPDAPISVTHDDEENALIRRMRGERMMPPKFASNGLSAIILKACSYDGRDRYPDAEHMRHDLEALAKGRPVVVRKSGNALDETVSAWGAPLNDSDCSVNRTNKRDYYSNKNLHKNEYQPQNVNKERQHQNENRNRRNIKVLIPVIVILAIIGIVVFIVFGIGELRQENENVLTDVDSAYVTVLSSDWDWDSGWNNEDGTYGVHGIIYIENKAEIPITSINFSVKDEKGNIVTNAETGEDIFVAYGFIDSGSKGIMVASIPTNEEKVRPSDETYSIITAYANKNLTNYVIPSGRITENYGPKNDYYDISIDNKNEIETNSNSIIVAVKMNGNSISDSDASGHIETAIPENTVGYYQEKAFIDPNFYGNSELNAYIVYAIDTDLYETYDGSKQ